MLSNFVEFKKKNQNIKLIGYTWVRNIFRPDKIYKKITQDTINFSKIRVILYFPDKPNTSLNAFYMQKKIIIKKLLILND